MFAAFASHGRSFATGFAHVLVVSWLFAGCGRDTGLATGPDSPLEPWLAIGVDPRTGASIETNQDDYAPGEVVHVTGRGWASREVVVLTLTEEPQTHPDVHREVRADQQGFFTLHLYDVQPHDLGVVFRLTARGTRSGSLATAVFTDGNWRFWADPALPLTLRYDTFYTNAVCGGAPGSVDQPLTIPSGSFVGIAIDPGKTIRFRAVEANDPTGYTFDRWEFWNPADAATYLKNGTVVTDRNICLEGHGDGVPKSITVRYKRAPVITIVPTSTALSASPTPSIFGQAVTFTATVTRTGTGTAVTTGNVVFREGESCITGAVLQPAASLDGSGRASYVTSGLSAGNHTIRACYEGTEIGSPRFAPSEGAIGQDVHRAPTSLTLTLATSETGSPSMASVEMIAQLTSDAAACLPGQPISFTYASGGGEAPTDNSGVAWYQDELGPGVHEITAAFAGNANCMPSSDLGLVTVMGEGTAVHGGGWYRVRGFGSTRIHFGFSVRQLREGGSHGGELLWINPGGWQLKGTVQEYGTLPCPAASLVVCGVVSGIGVLQEWKPAAPGQPAGWNDSAHGVTVAFQITFYDGGPVACARRGCSQQEQPDWFGIEIDAVSAAVVPVSPPTQLKGGNIRSLDGR